MLPDGTEAALFVLRSSRIEARITCYGGRLVSLRAPDRAGRFAEVIVGPRSLGGFLAPNPHFGGVVGRYANRIAGGVLSLDGQVHRLSRNEGANTLHGGIEGFDRKLWEARVEGDALILSRVSPHGEEGFPGTLSVTVTYAVSEGDLRITYDAVTDRSTVVNLTHHAYFNLAGPRSRDVLDHRLTIWADAFTPVDVESIPTGEIRSVEGTPFDFRTPRSIGERIGDSDPQLRVGGGYDQNFVLGGVTDAPRLVARAVDPDSGRVLEVRTTAPGLQLYTGNHLGPSIRARGAARRTHGGFCLETQHFPDAPHHPAFPSTVLRPGERWRSETVYRLSTC